jgi:p-hydroxybenzoate 3-monooxygenase
MNEKTQVGIIGAGPAGLLLSHLLHLQGIDSVILEARSRKYVEDRVRAGVLEQGTVDLLCDTGLGDRLRREGLVHQGIELRFDGRSHRIALSDLTGGRSIWIYGQREVVKDLIDARLEANGSILFEVDDVKLSGIDSPSPVMNYQKDGRDYELNCDFIAGCDGFHGVSRESIPAGVLRTYPHVYPFGGLGILAAVAPSTEELI